MSEYTLEELKNKKAYILEDIRGGITPADDREADIYSFMRSYLDNELGGCDKAELLEELTKCISGQPYDGPEPCEASIQEALRQRPAPRYANDVKGGDRAWI